VGDPVARVVWDHQHIQMLESMPLDENAAPHRDEAVAMMRERFRERVGTLHGACLAAKRPEDAERVAAEGTKLDDTAEMRLALVGSRAREGEEPGLNPRHPFTCSPTWSPPVSAP
jgi:hypothetical protein